MNSVIFRIRQYFVSKVGQCSICMRQSFLAGLIAWGFWGAAASVQTRFDLAFLILAIALSALWGLHIVVYIMRSLRKEREEVRGGSGLAPHLLSRRRALKTGLQATAVAVAVSMPAMLVPTKVMAFCGQCNVDRDCGSEDSNWCCKNTAAVNSGTVCNECKKCV